MYTFNSLFDLTSVRCFLAVCLVAISTTAIANAQEVDPVLPTPRTTEQSVTSLESSVLTLQSLEHLALANNPTLPAAEAIVQSEQGSYNQVGLYPNPTVGYVRSDPDQKGQSASQGVFLSQEIVTPGKLKLNRSIEAAGIQKADWQFKAQRERVLNDVRIRYFDALGAQQGVILAKELEELAEQGVKLTKDLFEAKQAPRVDVLQAELQLQTIQLTHKDALYEYEAAWRQLAAVVGCPNLQPKYLSGNLEEGIPVLNWEGSLHKLLSLNPVLHAQASDLRAAHLTVHRAKLERFPNVTVQVVAERDYIQNYSTVSTLVALPIPLFNRNQGNITSTMAHVQQSQSELQRLQLALTDQLSVSFQQYQSLRTQSERLQQEILPRAKETYDLTVKSYRQGQFDFLRVLNARHTLFEARMAYLHSLKEVHKTAIQIEGLQLTGGLNPTEVGTALQASPGMGGTGARGALFQQLEGQRGGSNQFLPGAIQAGR